MARGSTIIATSPYEAANADLLREIIRQAEARLEAQLTSTLGADQRAMTFAGLMFAGAAALGAIAFTPALSGVVGWVIFFGSGLGISGGMAAASARPATWEYVGNVPSAWLEDISEDRPLHKSLAQSAGFYDEMIATNETVIRKAGRIMHGSMYVALATVVAAFLVMAFSIIL